MARKPMVTRTIKSTKVLALAVNTESFETSKISILLPRTYEDEKKMLKMAEKLNTNANVKIVKILSTEVTECLYGMDEEKFIENAEILPPRDANSGDAEESNSQD